MASGFDRFLASRLRALDPEKWDAFVRFLAAEMADLQARALANEAVADRMSRHALQIIEETIGPSVQVAEQKRIEAESILAVIAAIEAQALAILGEIEAGGLSADVVSETAGRLWLTPALKAAYDAKPGTSTVSDLIDAAISDLLGGATPAALDTLSEIAAALGSDPNLSATLTTALAGKLSKKSNLADLTNFAAARANLQVPSAAELAALDAATAAALAGKAPLIGGDPRFNTLRWTSAYVSAGNSDLNAFTTGGFYESGSWANGPLAGIWAQLHVYPSFNTDHVLQILTDQDTGRQWRRVRQAGTWEAWQEIGGPFIKVADTTVSTPVAYVEHGVDFSAFAFALTLARGISVGSSAAHRVGLVNAGGTILDFVQSGTVLNTLATSGGIFWSPQGIMAGGSLNNPIAVTDGVKLRIYGSLGDLDAGRVVTYGVRV